MSRTTEEINKVTGTVISLSVRLIFCAVVLLLLAEGISRGYRFGYEIFSSSAMEEAPGRDRTIVITGDDSDLDTCKALEDGGLIADGMAAFFQMKFYDYEIYPGTYVLNTSMTSKEILQALNQKPEEDTGDVSVEAVDAAEEENSTEMQESMTEESAAETELETGAEPENETEPEVEIRIN